MKQEALTSIKSRNPLRRFPVTFIILLALATCIAVMNALPREAAKAYDNMWLILIVANFASLWGELQGEQFEWSRLKSHFFGLLCAILGGSLSYLIQPQVLIFFFCAGLCCLILLVPAFEGQSRKHVWYHAIWCVIAALIAGAVLVFCLASYHLVAKIAKGLFGLALSQEGSYVFQSIFLILTPAIFFLSRLPFTLHEDDDCIIEDSFLSYLRPIFDFLILPLIVILTVLFYAYSLMIVFQGAMPSGQVASMSVFVAIVILARLLIEPFQTHARVLSRLFFKAWSLLLVVPVMMLVIFVAQRIQQYGVTPYRYLLVLGALYVVLVLIQQGFHRWRGDIRIMLLLAAFLLLLIPFGPWGLRSVVLESQMNRIISLYGMNGQIVPQPDIDDQEYYKAADLFSLIQDMEGMQRLLPYIDPTNIKAQELITHSDSSDLDYYDVIDALGFQKKKIRATRQEPTKVMEAYFSNVLDIDVNSYDRLAYRRVTQVEGDEPKVQSEHMVQTTIRVYLRHDVMQLRLHGIEDSLKMNDISKALKINRDKGGSPDSMIKMADQVIDVVTKGGRTIRFFPLYLEFDNDQNDLVESFHTQIAYRDAEWRP